MPDNDWMLWNAQPQPSARAPRKGEVLFAFTRVSDHTPINCELRFHGESYGWEAVFLRDGDLFISRGGFALRAEAERWARGEHSAQVIDGLWHPIIPA